VVVINNTVAGAPGGGGNEVEFEIGASRRSGKTEANQVLVVS
jgi:hypothetical protein